MQSIFGEDIIKSSPFLKIPAEAGERETGGDMK